MPYESQSHRTAFNRIGLPNFLGILLLLSMLLAGQTALPVHAVAPIFVSPTGPASGLCNNWANACDFQFALAHANSGDEMWLKHGVYKPTTTTDRTISFELKPGVSIYGGFLGNESSRSQRNPATYHTILSGDIDNDDINTDGNYIDETIADIRNNNTYRLVKGSTGIGSSAVLDGFTITGGKADGAFPYNAGGGIFNDHGSSPTLRNLTIIGNAAPGNPSPGSGGAAGGMLCVNASNPTIIDVAFNANAAPSGAGMLNHLSSPTLTNVTFSGNKAIDNGGGMLNDDTSNPRLTNITFNGSSARYGGGMYNYSSSPTLTNVTFSGNSATVNGGAMYNSTTSNPFIYDGIFWSDGSEIINSDGSSVPTIKDSVVSGGYAGGTHIITTNPHLGALSKNGGYTKTMALGVGSSAIDTGGTHHACASTDQRGVKRPQGPACDIGAYEAPVIKSFTSIGSQDGWIRETGETTTIGGTVNSGGPTLILGDDATRKQYRSIVSFNTAALPDNATIVSVQLTLKRISVTPPGTNPITLLQGIMLEVRKGYFGTTPSLLSSDFQAAPTLNIGPYLPALTAGRYTIAFYVGTFYSINKGGLTQIRLRFHHDDNNNAIANTLNLISGNDPTPANRPVLIVGYITP